MSDDLVTDHHIHLLNNMIGRAAADVARLCGSKQLDDEICRRIWAATYDHWPPRPLSTYRDCRVKIASLFKIFAAELEIALDGER